MSDFPTYPLTVDGVGYAIAAIPSASEDIAEWLTGLGIRGQLDNACACPIARYLHKALPDAGYVQVDGTDVFIRGTRIDDLGFAEGYEGHPDLPHPVTCFIEDFDSRIYPELIEVTAHADPAA